MISDEEVDASLSFLLEKAGDIAAAESELADMEERKEVEIAVIAAGDNLGKNYNEKKRNALATQRFGEFLTRLEIARLKFAELNYQWKAHEKRISVWQSQNKREQGPRP